MKKSVRDFANYFTEELGKFIENVKRQESNPSKTEMNAVITETFYLLGRKHEEWKKKARIK